jgi:hypothetical protein
MNSARNTFVVGQTLSLEKVDVDLWKWYTAVTMRSCKKGIESKHSQSALLYKLLHVFPTML